ncbi:hypothetical protein RQP46_008800 [Phenoliferia psychrophenolica]
MEYEVLIDSAEVELSDWIRIASDIEANYSLFDSDGILRFGFVVPARGPRVILTGAQIPLSELLNDSLDNLLGALIIAGHYRIPEVCLFFNHKLLRGNRAIKASSDEFDAFASPSLPALANVGIEIEVAWQEVLRPGLRAFRAHKALSANVATLRIFPGISGSSVRAFLSAGDVRGVVLQSYGAGNAPRREELLSAFREAADRGVVIVNVSQCATGAVSSDIYETGRALAAVGITGGADMTVECALAKLSYLLSKPELSPAQVRKLISRPLRGELTLSSPVPTYSSPIEADDRLRTLFSQVISIAPTPSSRGPASPAGVRTRSLSGSDFVLGTTPTDALLPPEFSSPWPATQRDAESAEQAILPYLLGQAAARPDDLLATLIESLRGPQPTSTTPNSAITLLNEPSTPALQTPLHLAVLSGQTANVVLLLAHGASVHSRDVLSHSSLFYAARLGSSPTHSRSTSPQPTCTPSREDLLGCEEDGELSIQCGPLRLPLGEAPWVLNEGSTARERNWLSWVKLSVTLFVITAALLLRFSFSSHPLPKYEYEAERPLGILFFCAAWGALMVGIFGFFSFQTAMRRRDGFIYSGPITQILVWAIGCLTLAACILLLIADDNHG